MTNIKQLQKEWEEIEPESVERLVTKLDIYLHFRRFYEAVKYVESWVKYRSSFVRELLKNEQEKT